MAIPILANGWVTIREVKVMAPYIYCRRPTEISGSGDWIDNPTNIALYDSPNKPHLNQYSDMFVFTSQPNFASVHTREGSNWWVGHILGCEEQFIGHVTYNESVTDDILFWEVVNGNTQI